MTVTQQGAFDFTLMYLTHAAFRRDLGRLADAVAAGRAYTKGVQAGWTVFKDQLNVHHSVEDAALWPRVASAASGRPEAIALMEEMEAEHAALHPRLDAVEAAMAHRATDLASRVADLGDVLERHMRHEEDSALPLIEEVLPLRDWGAFRGAMARRQGVKGAAMYVPWVLDGLGPADKRRFMIDMGRRVQVANTLVFQWNYKVRHLWGR